MRGGSSRRLSVPDTKPGFPAPRPRSGGSNGLRGRHSPSGAGNHIARLRRVPVAAAGAPAQCRINRRKPSRAPALTVSVRRRIPGEDADPGNVPFSQWPANKETGYVGPSRYIPRNHINTHRCSRTARASLWNISLLRPKKTILDPQAGLLTQLHRLRAVFSASAPSGSRTRHPPMTHLRGAPLHSSGPVGEFHPVPYCPGKAGHLRTSLFNCQGNHTINPPFCKALTYSNGSINSADERNLKIGLDNPPGLCYNNSCVERGAMSRGRAVR